MKTDLMLVPSDTVVLAEAEGADGGWTELSAPMPPGPSVFLEAVRRLYLSRHCPEGPVAYAGGCEKCSRHGKCDGEAVAGSKDADPSSIALQIGAPLLAREAGGRVEPLYPAPDDLVLDEKQRDYMFAQPAFLEPLRGDFVRHDKAGLRLLVPSSKKPGADRLGVFLTRKGVRTWAERKVERLADGEHYLLPRRLYELEQRTELRAGKTYVTVHARLRPGVGFVVPVEIPEGRPAMPIPGPVLLGPSARTAWAEEAQIPQPETKQLKPARRWRLSALAPMPAQEGGLPSWLDPKEWTTRAPYPEGGKLFAAACRGACGSPDAIGTREPGQATIPAGTTWFLEFNDPVRVEQSTWILAGGY